MDINDLRSLVTVAGLALFLGLMAWTWWPGRKPAHEAAARLPFEEGTGHEPERRAAPSRARPPRGGGRGTPRTGGRHE